MQVRFPFPIYPLVAPEVLVETFEAGDGISRYVAEAHLRRSAFNSRCARLPCAVFWLVAHLAPWCPAAHPTQTRSLCTRAALRRVGVRTLQWQKAVGMPGSPCVAAHASYTARCMRWISGGGNPAHVAQ